jgi:hypothetical protein
MLTDGVTSDRVQFVQVQTLADADGDHRDVGGVGPQRREHRLARLVRLSVGQHDTDARMTFIDRAGAMSFRETVYCHFIEGQVGVRTPGSVFDIVDS